MNFSLLFPAVGLIVKSFDIFNQDPLGNLLLPGFREHCSENTTDAASREPFALQLGSNALCSVAPSAQLIDEHPGRAVIIEIIQPFKFRKHLFDDTILKSPLF